MNLTLKSFMLLIASAMIVSCSIQQPISKTSPENNRTCDIEYLFEHDGCKVYRFRDMGQNIYFTNCQGIVTTVKNDSVQIRVINR
jgi:hypothetical protein